MKTYYKNRWVIPSDKRDTSYIISQRRSDGGFECSCNDWIYRHHQAVGYACKHIQRNDFYNRLTGGYRETA